MKPVLSDHSMDGRKVVLIQVVLWEELTVIVNDRWSRNTGGTLGRVDSGR